MLNLRKIGLSALAIFALTSCGAASESSSSVKSYLLNQSFPEANIIVMNAENYKKTQSSTFVADGLQEYLSATKPSASDLPEQFFCWFFETFDQADKFVKDYVGDMYHTLDGRCKDPSMGSRNNTAWAGTNSIAVGLGWASK